jgi:hypothetical protein
MTVTVIVSRVIIFKPFLRFSSVSYMRSILRLVWLGVAVSCLHAVAPGQIQIDRPKQEPPLPNPYTIAVPREQVIKVAKEVFASCKIPVDVEASKPEDAKLVTRYVVFTKGVTAKDDLEHLSTLPASDVRYWIQGRYTLELSILPLDGKRSQLQVIAHIQGRISGVMNDEKWIDSTSNGKLEDEVLRGLAGKILGLDLSVKGNNRRRLLNCEY